MSCACLRRSGGFSLVELIMIIVVLSVGIAGLTALYGELGGAIDVNDDIGAGAQAAQRCAEHVLMQRRASTGAGYAGVVSGLCAALPAVGGFTATDVAAAYGGAGCPVGATCQQVTVTASNGSTSRVVTFMVVDY
jgi:Tfp pilus assembly protein PilV